MHLACAKSLSSRALAPLSLCNLLKNSLTYFCFYSHSTSCLAQLCSIIIFKCLFSCLKYSQCKNRNVRLTNKNSHACVVCLLGFEADDKSISREEWGSPQSCNTSFSRPVQSGFTCQVAELALFLYAKEIGLPLQAWAGLCLD